MNPQLKSDLRLITCILPRGTGVAVLHEIHEKGIYRADIHAARAFVGSGAGGVFDRVEKDILNVVIAAGEADDFFEWIYHRTRMYEVPGGFMFMAKLACGSPFLLPGGIPSETL
ncbi:hypothetical protein MYX77_04100 [Acidobacteriia bacterium AH_259_A11_L15]|nr:hypothetical protein [Acidobacteriia bacterium AH_259_A11_L15]